MQKVTSLIDIKAPCQEVFNTIVDLERRMQLSPLWGLNRLLKVTPNFPEPGSSYRIRVLTDVPFGLAQETLNDPKNALSLLAQALFLKFGQTDSGHLHQTDTDDTKQIKVENKHQPEEGHPVEQEYYVAEYQPPHKFSYYLEKGCETLVTWRFQSIPFGTRINYEEVFCDENMRDDEDFIPTVHRVIQEWLTNIKRYSELRDGRGRKIVKWFLDHIYLKLRPDQRRAVLLMLFLQMIGLVTFVIAVIGWGVASLFF